MNKASRLFAAGLLLLAGQIYAMGDEGGPGGPGGGGPGPGMHGEGGPGGGERILKQLDLSEAQKDKLKALRRARRDKNQARQNALEDAREDMKDLMGKADRSKAHEDKIRAAHKVVAKLMAEQGEEHLESMLEVRSILTDAQLKKFIELKEKEHGGMGMHGKHGKHGKRGGPEGHEGHGDDDDKEDKRP